MKKFEITTKETVFSTWTYYADSEKEAEELNGEFGEKLGEDFFEDLEVIEVKEFKEEE